MIPRADIEVAANAYGEDALGPLFTKPLVIETDMERAEREEREWEAQSYANWVMDYQSWERDWWESEANDGS